MGRSLSVAAYFLAPLGARLPPVGVVPGRAEESPSDISTHHLSSVPEISLGKGSASVRQSWSFPDVNRKATRVNQVDTAKWWLGRPMSSIVFRGSVAYEGDQDLQEFEVCGVWSVTLRG